MSDVASLAILFFGVLAGVKFSPNPLILCNLLSETETKLLRFSKWTSPRKITSWHASILKVTHSLGLGN